MPGRPRTVTDERIFAAVRSAVGRVGVERLTLAEVATDAGVTTGALARRFSTKRNLLLSFSRAMADGATRVREVYASADSPLAGVVAAMVDLVDADADPVELANHVSFLGMEIADPEFREVLAAHNREVHAALEEFLREAVAEGELEVADPSALARVLVSLWHGVQINWSLAGETSPAGEMRRQVESVLAPLRLRG